MKKPRVLVVGDFMLDETIFGDVDRISPEAPVPIVNFKKSIYTLGGAGNVVINLHELGCEVSILGICGNDNEGNWLRKKFKDTILGQIYLFSDGRNTTKKIRIKSRNQQLLRLDYETTLPYFFPEKFMNFFLEKYENYFDFIVISDYAKGVISKELITKLKIFNKKIFVDPKPKNWLLYDNVYLLKPNKKEYAKIVDTYQEEISYEYLLVTEGRDGMTLITDATNNEYVHFDATEKEFVDLTGAGDTVIAVVSVLDFYGINIEEAVNIANKCAGIVITKEGTVPITEKEVLKIIEDEGII